MAASESWSPYNESGEDEASKAGEASKRKNDSEDEVVPKAHHLSEAEEGEEDGLIPISMTEEAKMEIRQTVDSIFTRYV